MPCFIKTLIFQLELYAYCLIFVGSYFILFFKKQGLQGLFPFPHKAPGLVLKGTISWPLVFFLKLWNIFPSGIRCGCIREKAVCLSQEFSPAWLIFQVSHQVLIWLPEFCVLRLRGISEAMRHLGGDILQQTGLLEKTRRSGTAPRIQLAKQLAGKNERRISVRRNLS